MRKIIPIASNKPLRIKEIVDSHPGVQIVIMTQYDEERAILHALIPFSVVMDGKMKHNTRIETLELLRKGVIRVIISSPELMGTGLNLQYLHVVIFSWSSDSWKDYHQTVGRFLRYGQTEQVEIYIPYTDLEAPMLQNVMRKQKENQKDSEFQEQLYIECLLDELKDFTDNPIGPATVETWHPEATGESWRMIHGDCVPVMASLPADQFDMAVFSIPFCDLFLYTDKTEDLGNSNLQDGEFAMHTSFFAHHLFQVMKPGCVVAFHVAPLAILKSNAGYTGIRDFPSECRQIMQDAGFIYEGKATIRKNPQAQAIRTHAHGLLFKTLKKDSRKSRFAIPDYLMKFVKPGEAAPIANTEVTNEDWIQYADADWHVSPDWDWVSESNTLSRQTKNLTEGDTKHICPLQIDVIDACIRLWSAKGEHVLSPFAGIASEGVVSVRLGRKFTGIELKSAYFEASCKNLSFEEKKKGQQLNFQDAIERKKAAMSITPD